jgi:hypothetical protein
VGAVNPNKWGHQLYVAVLLFVVGQSFTSNVYTFIIKMVKKGRRSKPMSAGTIFGMFIVSVAVVVGLIFFINTQFFSAVETGASPTEKRMAGSINCPDDQETDLYIEVQNILNDTGAEKYDATVYILDDAGSIITSITDTTSPSATSVTCGYEYQLAVVSADADGGDNSVVSKILANPSGSDVMIESGIVKFTADRARMDIDLGMEQHGVLEFRLFDKQDNAYAYDSGDATNSDWEADGVTFRDGDNSTAYAVGSGGDLELRVEARTVDDDEDFADQYVLMALELPVTVWETPAVKIDGSSVSEVSGLSSDENLALSDYEYIYRIDGDLLNDGEVLIDLKLDALSGQNPTADIEVDFYSAGQFLKTDGTGLLTGTHKDDSSRTVVYTAQDLTVDIS